MPKIKTHSGAKKRIKQTPSGKLLRRRAYSGHFLAKKGGARKRGYAHEYNVNKSDRQKIKRTLGA